MVTRLEGWKELNESGGESKCFRGHGVILTFTLNLPQGNGGCRDGWGTEVSRQGLGRVRGHAPQVFLPKHLPPGGRAGECLSPILSARHMSWALKWILMQTTFVFFMGILFSFFKDILACSPHRAVSQFPWRWGSCTLAPGAVWPAG